MEFLNDGVLLIMEVFATLIGYAIGVVIIIAVGRFVWDFLKGCAKFGWETVHKSSYNAFIVKIKEKRKEKDE